MSYYYSSPSPPRRSFTLPTPPSWGQPCFLFSSPAGYENPLNVPHLLDQKYARNTRKDEAVAEERIQRRALRDAKFAHGMKYDLLFAQNVRDMYRHIAREERLVCQDTQFFSPLMY